MKSSNAFPGPRALAVSLCLGALLRASTALAQIDAGAVAPPQSPLDAGTDATASSSFDAAPMTNEERRRYRLMAGTFRASDSRGPVVGVRFSPLPAERSRGQFWILYRRRSAPGTTRFESGEYRLDRTVVRTRNAAGVEGAMDYELEASELRLRIGGTMIAFERATSICHVASDCARGAADAPVLTCTQHVEWSCEQQSAECLAHCGPASRTRGRRRCGPRWCEPGLTCCNSYAGTCVPPGGGCGQ